VELPRLQPLYEQYADRGFEVVAVEGKGQDDRAQQFIADNGLTYTFVKGADSDPDVVRDLYQVQLFPTSMLIDREGRVMYYHLGFEAGDETKMAAEIEKLL